MRLLSELYHSINEPVFIFGTGPSIECINSNDYRDKFCIGINYAWQKVLNIDYLCIHELEVYEIIKDHFPNDKLIIPDYLNKNKSSEHVLITNPDCVYYTKHKYDLSNGCQDDIRLDIGAHNKIFAYTTTTHSAIHIAAYMGATEIYLIGIDYRHYPGGKIHFNTGIDKRYDEQDWQVFRKHRIGDEYITRKLDEQGIKVINLSEKLLGG